MKDNLTKYGIVVMNIKFNRAVILNGKKLE